MNISHFKNKNIHLVECENWQDVYGYEKSEMKEDIINYIEQLQQENNQLKLINKEHQQINGELRQANKLLNEQYIRLYKDYIQLKAQIEEYQKALDETQQKEFIKYLEDMLDDENDIFSVARVKDVLRKYKEIIGTTNE